MDQISEKRLASVHPELARRVRAAISKLVAFGLDIHVTSGLRTAAEQDALYAQGRTKPGAKVTNARAWQSNHSFGLACDLVPFVNGRPDWNASEQVWEQVGDEAEAQGLEWGGRWRFVDKPHVQLPGLSIAQCQVLHRQGGLPLVWQRASVVLLAAETGNGHAITRTPELALPPKSQIETRLAELADEPRDTDPFLAPIVQPGATSRESGVSGAEVGWPEMPNEPSSDMQPMAGPKVEKPTKWELTPRQIASWVRAGITALSGIVGALGYDQDGLFAGRLSKYESLAIAIAGFLLPRVWSAAEAWYRAKFENKAIVEALVTRPLRADGTLVTPAQIKAAVVAKEGKQ